MPLRHIIPAPLRASTRAFLRDLPFRLRDLPADLRQSLAPTDQRPLPPPSLRQRVAANSSRQEFLEIGRRCATDLLNAFQSERGESVVPCDWLDFGCGCGRVARHLIDSPWVSTFTGADIDPGLIRWADRHLPGTWLTTAESPPLPVTSDSMDVIVSVSVFTHLPESQQMPWIREMRRILRSGGLLLASTHPPAHAAHLPAPHALDPAEVEADGFAHVASIGPFNHQSSFHSADYLRSTGSTELTLRQHLSHGLAGYQDLSIWEA